MPNIIRVLFLWLCATLLQAQAPPVHIAGELILSLQPDTNIKIWMQSKQAKVPSLLIREALMPNVFLLAFDARKMNENQLLSDLRKDSRVAAVQFNHRLQWRNNRPNDPKYDQWQWNLELMGLPDAWAHTTGGLTALGDTIVVAVLDGGCDLQHEDLAANIWYNHQEIPGDGIDNDQNGFVDDYQGWHLVNNNDQHSANGHGTSINGIIGAVGNNAKGMAGINWQVKLMQLSAGEADLALESNILKAYGYVLNMRRLYRTTNGQKGAFVVAANLSAGINYADAADYPLWCAMYDSLGKEGILCSGAVMNDYANIDLKGDMPSTCPSDFLITLTNATQYDALAQYAAYGRLNVDMAAPGAVYSTRVGNTYNVFGGTSGAAPHAAGAIALLAAYPNSDWAYRLKTEPEATAQQIRSFLMLSVARNEAFADKTASGGRLDIGAAMALLHKTYTTPENSIAIDFVGDGNQALLRFEIEQTGTYHWDIVDAMGRLRYRSSFVAAQSGIHSLWLNWDSPSHELLFLRLLKDGKRVAAKKLIR